MATYSDSLEQKLREGSRGKNIGNTPIRELITERVDTYSANQKKNTLLYLRDILDKTPNDLKDSPELFREAMIGASYEEFGKGKGNVSQKLLSGIMEDAGAGESWPRKTLIAELGKDTANDLFDLEAVRRSVTFDDDVFKNIKKTMTILSKQGDNEALAQLALHVFGGFRPQDLNGIKVSDINFRTGIVKSEIKTGGKKGGTQRTTGYFAPPLLDAIKLHLGDRTDGLLFENTQSNSTRINKVFAQVFPADAITAENLKTGVITTKSLQVKELRNFNESLLSAQGVDPTADSRKALTFRMAATQAEGYVDNLANRRTMKEMVFKNLAMIAGYSETPTVSQFFEDVGIPASNTTKQIAVTQGALEMYEGYKDTLSPEFVESVPPGDGIEFKAPVEADPDLSEGYKKTALSGFEKQTAQNIADTADIVIESAPKVAEAEQIKGQQKRSLKDEKTKQQIDQTIADDIPPDQRNPDKADNAIKDKLNKKAIRKNALKAAKTLLVGAAGEAISRVAFPLEARAASKLSLQMNDLLRQRRGVDPNSPEYDALTKQIEEAQSALTTANVDILTLGTRPVFEAMGKGEQMVSQSILGLPPKSEKPSNDVDEQMNNLIPQP